MQRPLTSEQLGRYVLDLELCYHRAMLALSLVQDLRVKLTGRAGAPVPGMPERGQLVRHVDAIVDAFKGEHRAPGPMAEPDRSELAAPGTSTPPSSPGTPAPHASVRPGGVMTTTRAVPALPPFASPDVLPALLVYAYELHQGVDYVLTFDDTAGAWQLRPMRNYQDRPSIAALVNVDVGADIRSGLVDVTTVTRAGGDRG